MQWSIPVIEVRHVLCEYIVEAPNIVEANNLATKGETVCSEDHNDLGVVERIPQGFPTPNSTPCSGS